MHIPPRVHPFVLEGLPRLPREHADWSRSIAATWSAWARPVTVPRLGQIAVRPVRIRFPPLEDNVGPQSGALRLEAQGDVALLALEPTLALAIVGAVFGVPASLTQRSLGRAERGVLAAAVAAWLSALEAEGIRVDLDQDGGPPAAELAAALDLRIRAAGTTGAARLLLPVGWAGKAACRPPCVVDPARLAPQVQVEIGRTRLPAAAWAEVEVGDAVVFDGLSPAHAREPWPVEVRFGAKSVPATMHENGTLRRTGPMRQRNHGETRMSNDASNDASDQAGDDTKTTPGTAPDAVRPPSPEMTEALAAAPVEVVAELGRVTLRGDELLGFLEGGVLRLGGRRADHVQLRTGDRPWAVGELVTVDGELAVRITRMMR